MKLFGKVIRDARKLKRMTAIKLADKVGISTTYVSRIENGKEKPPARDKVVKMAYFLSLDEDLLLILSGRLPLDILSIIQENPVEALKIIRGMK